MGFNIDEIESANTNSSYSDDDESEEIIYNFFERFFELHKIHQKPFIIREFEEMTSKLMLAPINNLDSYTPKTLLIDPFKMLSVSTNGDFSSFCPELLNYKSTEKYGDIRLGNVFNTSLFDSMQTPKFKQIYGDIKIGIEACRNNCEYFGLCQSGSPSNKLGEKGSFAVDETMHCRLIKKIPIDVVLKGALEEILANSNAKVLA